MPVPVNSEPLSRPSARTLVFAQLRSWIEEGVLKPGEVLHDVEIAKSLGVSRTPVREALQMLEQHGVVETVPGMSTRVCPISRDDAWLVYRPLSALQKVAVELGGPSVSEQDLEQMEHLNEQLMGAVKRGRPALARGADNDFHDVLVQRAENPYLSNVIASLRIHTRRLEALYFADAGPAHRSYEQHKMILAALRAGDVERASELTRRNFMLAPWATDPN